MLYSFLVPLTVRAVTLTPQQQWVEALAQCESGGRDTIKILDSNNKYSYGRLMFQKATWLSYSDEFGTSMENIYNGNLQTTVALYILNDGGWRHWYNCAKKITKKIGPYPMPSTPS